MPDTEEALCAHLGDQYVAADWKPAFDTIFKTEEDDAAAFAAVNELEVAAKNTSILDPPDLQTNSWIWPSLPQLTALKTDLMTSVADLKGRMWIVGTALTLEDLLNPVEELKVGKSPYDFPGGDDEIIQQAINDTNTSSCKAVAIKSSDSESESDDEGVELKYRKGIDLCKWLEKACVMYSDADGFLAIALQNQLRKLQAHFWQLEFASLKQSTLHAFINSN